MKKFKVAFKFKISTPFSVPVSYKYFQNKVGVCVMPNEEVGLFELTQQVSEDDFVFFILKE